MNSFIYINNYIKDFLFYIYYTVCRTIQAHFFYLAEREEKKGGLVYVWWATWSVDAQGWPPSAGLQTSSLHWYISEQSRKTAFERGILMLLNPSEFRISWGRFSAFVLHWILSSNPLWLESYTVKLSVTGIHLDLSHARQWETEDILQLINDTIRAVIEER